MDANPRFYVRHQRIPKEGFGTRGSRLVSTIRDRWYCCWDVYRLVADDTVSDRQGSVRIRAEAEALCAEWNAEHDALLAAEGMASR